jgi:hypothetical protein
MHRKFSVRRSKTMKKRWKDPEYRNKVLENRSEGLKASWTDKRKRKHGKAHSKTMLALWADPVFRKRMEKKRKQQVTPRTVRHMSKGMKKKWADPKYYKKMCKVRKDQVTPEIIKANSKRITKLWADTEYKKFWVKAIHNKTWRKAIAKSNREHKTGVPAWNKGLNKDTHPSLMSASKKLTGRMPDYNKYKSWYPDDKHKEIEMRSSWEVKFALWLDEGGIKWEYEPRWFNVGSGKWRGTSYTPDFWLVEQNEYVELKGRFTKENKRKMNKFFEIYPDVKLFMFFGKHLAKVLQFKKAA